MKRLFLSIARMTFWTVLICASFNYYGDASRRETAHGWQTQTSTKDEGIYTAKNTSLGSEIMLIRLYKTGANTLLAERTYDSMDIPRVFWTKDKLIYSTNDSSMFYDGAINLPPSWIDKVLAQLP